jgi:drug/metabolite transporter (DMT)-like permease
MDKTPASIATLIGSALASASGLLAIWLLSYGYATGGLHHNDPLLLAGIRIGIALSVAALVFAGIGIRKPSRMRWIGLAWAAAGCLFWVCTLAMN